MKKTGLIGSVYDFSVDYNAIAVNGILNIHKYLMKKNALQYIMFGFIEKMFGVAMSFSSCNVLNVNSLKCVSVSNQESGGETRNNKY